MAHKLSSKIDFKKISKEVFNAFLDSVKNNNIEEYNLEGLDGFLDLYNFWCDNGGERRVMSKTKSNIHNFKLKQKS